MPLTPGPIVLFGSGETSPAAQKVFDSLLRRLPPSPQVALLETPAGYETNSDRVIRRVADYLTTHLQNYDMQINVVAARARGTPLSPDAPEIVSPLLQAQMIFMGPGSPSYAARQLRGSLAWQYLLARHRLGAALVFASAAAVAVSAFALPVYEIYKVGEDLHWKPGLDLFGMYGLPLVFIPHWNNNDGGIELDTSRCFMSQERFARLMTMLPPGQTVIGIDEKTALVMDFAQGVAQVMGLGSVTLIHTGPPHSESLSEIDLHSNGLLDVVHRHSSHVHLYNSGATFHLHGCCPVRLPLGGEGLDEQAWQQALEANQAVPETDSPPPEVLALVEQRQAARRAKDWAASDRLRAQISALGWKVVDTPSSPKLERLG